MKKQKIIFILIASILTVVIANAFWIRGALIDQRAGFPKSIKLGSVLYENKKVNMAGPGGLSRKLTVYEIPAKSVDRISEGGVDYLKSMPPSIGERVRIKPPRHFEGGGDLVAPWWGRLNDWQQTPIPAGGKWGRGSDRNKDKDQEEWQPTLANYYGGSTSKRKFVSAIPSNYAEVFEEIISSPGACFTYGGYRGWSVLVVAPSHQMAFYLFQD